MLPDGRMTATWKNAIRDRHAAAEFKTLAAQRRPLQPDELAWFNLVKAQLERWRTTIPELNRPFVGATPPPRLVLLLGNAGGNDGFTYRTDTICFDLADWRENYGPADAPGNDDRVQRVLSHEYTHLLVARWTEKHPFPRTTPYRRAVYVLFNEGLGNYYSLSQAWRAKDGMLPDAAQVVLTRNTPILLDRMQRLQTATREDEAALTNNLSSGPFDRKWGAVTIALWLSQDQSSDPDALRRFIAAGPVDVPAFIQRHLQKTDP
jgi:hypothetical protein